MQTLNQVIESFEATAIGANNWNEVMRMKWLLLTIEDSNGSLDYGFDQMMKIHNEGA